MPNRYASKTYIAQLQTEVQIRKCLKCRKEFKSLGPGNRLCMSCNGKNSEEYNKETHRIELSNGRPILE